MDLEGGTDADSRERRWFVNSPACGPDGTTSSRAALREGAFARRRRMCGCITRLARADGLQVTERTGWQKGQRRSRSFPPDGKILLQQGVTPVSPSNTQGSNGTIYANHAPRSENRPRAPRGQRAGGSVTPQISPDGKTLAYVRRVRLESKLYLRDRNRGATRELFGGLDKDLQEPGGARPLPPYSWNPDGRSIVIWDRAVRRVDVASGKAAPVPFTAKVTDVERRVRFPTSVAPGRIPVRMLRDVRTSPTTQGGRLQRPRLALQPSSSDGQPSRLTKDERMDSSRRSPARRSVDRLHNLTDADFGRVRVMRADAAAAGMSSRNRDTTSNRRFARRQTIVCRNAGDSHAVHTPPASQVCSSFGRGWRAGSGARRRRRGLSSITHGTRILPARVPQREERAVQRRAAAGGFAAAGRDEIAARPCGTTPRSSPVARWQVDRVRRALSHLRRAVPAHTAARSTSVQARRPIRPARVARCRLLSALSATARGFTGARS